MTVAAVVNLALFVFMASGAFIIAGIRIYRYARNLPMVPTDDLDRHRFALVTGMAIFFSTIDGLGVFVSVFGSSSQEPIRLSLLVIRGLAIFFIWTTVLYDISRLRQMRQLDDR